MFFSYPLHFFCSRGNNVQSRKRWKLINKMEYLAAQQYCADNSLPSNKKDNGHCQSEKKSVCEIGLG